MMPANIAELQSFSITVWLFHFLLLLNNLSKLSFSFSTLAVIKISIQLKSDRPIKAMMLTQNVNTRLSFPFFD